jgi:uncharacterized protein YabE (DUF348 family)
MKSLFLISIIALLMVVCVTGASAQLTSTSSKSYARNQTDTVTTPSNLALFGQVDVEVVAADSFNCKIYVETKPKDGSTWTVKDSLSINTTSAVKQIWLLRQSSTNLIPGVQIDVRFRPVFAATVNTLLAKSYSMVVGYTR